MEKILKEKILKKMEEEFKYSKKRIDHTMNVLNHAEQINISEGADEEIVFLSALMHDIGISECEIKYGSIKGSLQEIEGPIIARRILETADFKEDIIAEVCSIVGSHHSRGEIETINFKVIWDADWLVNIPDIFDISNKKKLAKAINNIFMTKAGLERARKIYL